MKRKLKIDSSCEYGIELILPASHVMNSKKEALEFMTKRGMQKECEVITESKYKYHNPIKIIDAWRTEWVAVKELMLYSRNSANASLMEKNVGMPLQVIIAGIIPK